MNPLLKPAAAALLALPLGLTGCTPPQYQVKVNNRIDQPVTAVLWERAEGETRRKVARFIGPQDSHTLGAVPAQAGNTVWLTVDFAGNEGRPEELPLGSGLTVVNVLRREDGSQGRIRLQEVD